MDIHKIFSFNPLPEVFERITHLTSFIGLQPGQIMIILKSYNIVDEKLLGFALAKFQKLKWIALRNDTICPLIGKALMELNFNRLQETFVLKLRGSGECTNATIYHRTEVPTQQQIPKVLHQKDYQKLRTLVVVGLTNISESFKRVGLMQTQRNEDNYVNNLMQYKISPVKFFVENFELLFVPDPKVVNKLCYDYESIADETIFLPECELASR